jgi:hypothetical protein
VAEPVYQGQFGGQQLQHPATRAALERAPPLAACELGGCRAAAVDHCGGAAHQGGDARVQQLREARPPRAREHVVPQRRRGQETLGHALGKLGRDLPGGS